MKQVLNCSLTCVEHTDKAGRKFTNFYLTTENGTSVQIKLAFYNAKLNYKLLKEVENSK